MARQKFKGAWPINRPGRPHPFGVQWREKRWDETANGGQGGEIEERKTEFFDTAEKRDARAAQLRKDRKSGSLVSATRSEAQEWQAFQKAVKGVQWQDVVAGWRAWMMQAGIVECTVTVDKAVKDHLAAAKKMRDAEPPQMSADTYRQKDHKLRIFAEQFGDLRLNQVTAPEVEAWIEDFDDVKSPVTFNNYRKHASTLFTKYVESGMLRRNPIEGVKLREGGGTVGILSVKETAHLFKFAMENERYRQVIGRLALEAFLGLRFSSGCRLEKKDINFTDRGVLLPKRKLKTKERHYVDGMPAQLWEWLAITPDECWTVTPRQYLALKSKLFVEAGVPHPHNCFRHSFCTYDVAANKNPGKTAYFLCHTDQELLWSTYKGNAREIDGVAYQTITPETVALLAKGYEPLVAKALPAA